MTQTYTATEAGQVLGAAARDSGSFEPSAEVAVAYLNLFKQAELIRGKGSPAAFIRAMTRAYKRLLGGRPYEAFWEPCPIADARGLRMLSELRRDLLPVIAAEPDIPPPKRGRVLGWSFNQHRDGVHRVYQSWSEPYAHGTGHPASKKQRFRLGGSQGSRAQYSTAALAWAALIDVERESQRQARQQTWGCYVRALKESV